MATSTNTTRRLEVTDIDFDDIGTSLRKYLESQKAFEDYDFEGSAISTIVDLLAYVTHYNALNANLGINEAFLDTAQFRGSVVGHANTLGYIPGSAKAPAAYVDIVVNNPNSQNLTLPKGTRFRTRIDSTSYTFITDREYSTNNATFENVKLVQGNFQTISFLYDDQSNEKYLIPTTDVDTAFIRVEVYDSRNKSTFTVFREAKSLTEIRDDSPVFFLSENPEGLFEIRFGDGVLGRSLQSGNFVVVEYLATQKEDANGARIFNLIDNIGGNTSVSISTQSPARGGQERQSVDSVRRLAPLSYASQNRAVVPNDFDAIINENFSNVSSVKVWGGEDNEPPVYGKVFISVLPKEGEVLTQDEEQELLDEVIRPKSVITVTPELLDPEFLNITTETFFKYDPSRTNLTREQLESKVVRAIRDFNDNELGKFDNVFRYSRYLQVIDESDDAILNSFARIYLSKRFVPTLNIPTTYTLNFSTNLYESFGARPVIYESSTFAINGVSGCRFKDFLTSDGTRRVSIVKGVGAQEEVIVREAGVIEGTRIILESFAPQSIDGEVINIEAVPASYDIVGTLNNVVRFDCDCTRFNVQGEVDTIVSGRDYSGVNYRTFNRDSESTGSTTTTTTNNISSTSSSTTTTSSTTNTSPPSSSSSTTTPPPSSSGY